jgi:hypothetical protein
VLGLDCSAEVVGHQKTCEQLHKAGATAVRNNQLGSIPGKGKKSKGEMSSISSNLLLKGKARLQHEEIQQALNIGFPHILCQNFPVTF